MSLQANRVAVAISWNHQAAIIRPPHCFSPIESGAPGAVCRNKTATAFLRTESRTLLSGGGKKFEQRKWGLSMKGAKRRPVSHAG